MKGHRIMLQLSQPRDVNADGSPIWWDINDKSTGIDIKAKYKALYKYCIQDIIVERELDKRLLPLSESELALWHLDQKINYRGIHCDLEAVKVAIDIIAIEKKRLNECIQLATKNIVATCNASMALKNWINTFNLYKGAKYKSDGPPKKYKENGETKVKKAWLKGDKKIIQGVGKDVVKDLLETKLPKPVRRALLIRQEAAKNSTAKLDAILSGISRDNRVRGTIQFYGAASTGRWAGRRVQPHNMTRPTIDQKEIDELFQIILDQTQSLKDKMDSIRIFHGDITPRISDCLRGFITAAPGKRLISVDFSAVEGRVLAWLAGQESILTIFRGHGKIYEHTACQIYYIDNINDVTKDQRQIGKVATLALGFQGGVVAFQSMAKNYFVKVPDKQANIIKTNWRKANPKIVTYWYDLERAAIAAVKYPGQKFGCGVQGRQVTFLKSGSFLFCRLPSGRAICYPYPKLKNVKTPWGAIKKALTYKGEENYQFVTKVAYGGLLAENITQATARDLLVNSMRVFEKFNYNIVMHVHDEIVCEVDKNFGSLKEAENLMRILPKWAKDLPIEAKGWEGQRYRK